MKAIQFLLPVGIEIINGSKGPLFTGKAEDIFPNLVDSIRQLASYPLGARLRAGQFSFVISNDFPLMFEAKVITLPPDGWNIFASKVAEVADGYEDSPFYFGDCGYLWPPPEPDIGVQLIGKTLRG